MPWENEILSKKMQIGAVAAFSLCREPTTLLKVRQRHRSAHGNRNCCKATEEIAMQKMILGLAAAATVALAATGNVAEAAPKPYHSGPSYKSYHSGPSYKSYHSG